MNVSFDLVIKAISFDAVGTLFHLSKSVGHHYALVASEVGLKLDPAPFDRAFFSAWKQMPARVAIDGPRENDDKDWWRELVDLILLEKLRPRFHLAVISNFDGRLRMILEQLGVSKFFPHVFISSEIGADKPDPLIYLRAVKFLGIEPKEALHAGDDPERDWKGAAAGGLSIFRLDRQKNSLRDLLKML